MKIIIGSMMHESNTFSCVPTDLETFKRTQYLVGQELIEYHAGKRTEPGGMLDILTKKGVEIIPSISAWAIPSGKVTKEAYTEIKNTFIAMIRKNIEGLDGVLLALHGAMVVEGLEDPEADLLKEIRRIIPKGAYLGASLDMHAHLTPDMVECTDFFVAYRTHPHLDQYETGQKAARVLLRLIEKKMNLTKSYILIPMMVPGENRDETREILISELDKIDRDPKVVSSLIIISHPWSDLGIQGDSVLVITDNDQELAGKYARMLASKFWELRHDFPLDLYSIQQAVKLGKETKKKGPTVICEMGECLLGGASGDVVANISYLIERGIKDIAVAVVIDPESVTKSVEAGVGAPVQLHVGGKLYKEGNRPLQFHGKVKFIGENIEGKDKILVGYETKMGRMVVVEGHGVEMILVDQPGKLGGPSFFEAFGIDPRRKKFIVLKDSIGPLISYKDIASNVLLVDSPGWCKQLLSTIDFKNVPRPIFPLDPTMSWNI
jgi:microcystin degradation protein MlrC